MDVTCEASVEAAFEATVVAYGGLDIVVSNAGIAHAAAIDRMALADWERSFAVNATGHFLVARAALRVLKAQGLGGAWSSSRPRTSCRPGKDFAAYCASKAAEAQLAKVLALEGGPHGIRVEHREPRRGLPGLEALVPGGAPGAGPRPGDRRRASSRTSTASATCSASRVLPEDVAEAVLFLASDRAAKTTGCTLTVDGGVRDAFPR